MEEKKEDVKIDEKKSSEVSSEIKVEDLIKDTAKQLDEIKQSLQDKAVEVDELHSIALEQEKKFQTEVAEKESKIKELQQALESATKAKEEAITELNNMKEQALLSARLAKLESQGLLRSEETAKQKQAEKVKAMSEEVFAEYVEDLLDIRTQATPLKSDETARKSAEVETSNIEVQATEKLREMLTTMSKSEEDENKETSVKEDAKEVASKIDVNLLQKAFIGMLYLKNNN